MTRYFALVLLLLAAASGLQGPQHAQEISSECTLAGIWTQQSEGLGSSTWTITADGEATESGLGNAKGKATLSGGRLRIDWTIPGYNNSGYYEWALDESCKGSGVAVNTVSGAKRNTTVARTKSGPGQCDKENAAYNEVRLRAMASQTSLELLREYSKALDESYEATRQSAYADSVIDTASLAAGWPMGKGVQEYFRGKAKEKFTEKLVKAGFKSVEKALIKDPSLNGMFENLTSPIQTTSGIQYDLTKEYYKKLSKEMLGDVAGEAVTSVLDLMKFGLTAYKGMKRLEGIRVLARSTNDQIIQLQGKHIEQMDKWDNAMRARDICYDRVAKKLPPDTNNRFWADVMEYLGPNWKLLK